tara:strand:+ start:72189 stop:72608 length:420 start_codon:yes stop_codon:yes gene_type:complete
MKRLIGFRQAAITAAALFGLLSLFHLSIIIGIVIFDYAPVEFLWGGQMETRDELLRFEWVSLGVILICLNTVLIRYGWVQLPGMLKTTRVILWVLMALFFLNTLGNILAETVFEKIFAPVTLVLALLCLRLAMEPFDRS